MGKKKVDISWKDGSVTLTITEDGKTTTETFHNVEEGEVEEMLKAAGFIITNKTREQ
jgi:hypothetical protein